MADMNHLELSYKLFAGGNETRFDSLSTALDSEDLLAVMTSREKALAVDVAGSTDQTGVSTIADITTCAATFTAVAGHMYRVTGSAYITQNTGAGIVSLTVREGSTIIKVLAEASILTAGTARLQGSALILSPAAGSTVYKLSVSTSTNTCDIELSDATKRAVIYVEDLGLDLTA